VTNFNESHVVGLVVSAAVVGSANGAGVTLLTRILDVRILLELWSVRGKFSQKFSWVCVAGLDSWSSFGEVISKATFASRQLAPRWRLPGWLGQRIIYKVIGG